MKKVIIVFILSIFLISCNESSVKSVIQGTYDDTDTLQPILDSVAHAQDSILESTDIGGFKK
jgi:hypothetical protein